MNAEITFILALPLKFALWGRYIIILFYWVLKIFLPHLWQAYLGTPMIPWCRSAHLLAQPPLTGHL